MCSKFVEMAYNLTRMRSGGKEIAYRYDPCGNLVEKQFGALREEYGYNGQGLLREFTGHDGFAQQHQYDALGMRVRKQERGDRERQTLEMLLEGGKKQAGQKNTAESWHATSFLQDVTLPYGQVLAQCDGEQTTFYVYGLERIGAQNALGEKTLYQYDGRGSVAQKLSYHGAWKGASQQYGPFGQVMGAQVSGFGYNAEDYDAATGMLHLRMRQYEPGMGRFSQKDILKGNLGDALSLNRYSFVQNDPVGFVDPSGMNGERSEQYNHVLQNPLEAFDHVAELHSRGAVATNAGEIYLDTQRRIAHPTNVASEEAIKVAAVTHMVRNMQMKDAFGDQYRTRDEYFSWQNNAFSSFLRDGSGNLHQHTGPYAAKDYDMSFSAGFSSITIHHSDTRVRAEPRTANDIMLIHWQKPDLSEIGYHYIITRDGLIHEGRPIVLQGAHVSKGNTGNIGIILSGYMEGQDLSEEQKVAVLALVRYLQELYDIENDEVRPHNYFSSTLCPGKYTTNFFRGNGFSFLSRD